MAVDAAPLVTAPSDVSLEHYRKQIVPRFAHPNVPDTVLRVAHDGAAKLPIFHRATAEGLIGGAAGRAAGGAALGHVPSVRRAASTKRVPRSIVKEPHLHKEDWPLLRSPDPLEALKASPFAAWGLDRSVRLRPAYTAAVRLSRPTACMPPFVRPWESERRTCASIKPRTARSLGRG